MKTDVSDRDREALSGPAGADVLDTPEAGPAAIRGGTLRAAGYILGIALTVASTPLLIRHLGVVDYGRYVTVVSLIFIVGGVTEAGLTNIGVREFAERDERGRRRVVGDLLGLRLVLTLAGVLVATGFALIAGYDNAQVIGCLLAGAGLGLAVAQASYVVPLSTRLRLGWVTAAEVLRQVVTVLGIVALVVAGAALLPFFAVAILAALAALALTVWLVRDDISLRPTFDWREWWLLVRDALPYAAATALGIVYFRITVVLMSLISTDQQV
ncbi:MAG: oligosaccharide flippase family protein, partial [Solirubrobacteraceae bacterium]